MIEIKKGRKWIYKKKGKGRKGNVNVRLMTLVLHRESIHSNGTLKSNTA